MVWELRQGLNRGKARTASILGVGTMKSPAAPVFAAGRTRSSAAGIIVVINREFVARIVAAVMVRLVAVPEVSHVADLTECAATTDALKGPPPEAAPVPPDPVYQTRLVLLAERSERADRWVT